jgi:hypothetical protein
LDGSAVAQAEFRAAQYVRMSTEHQQYSTNNKADKIREYGEKRGIEIVRTYADDGKSGLSLEGRAALQKLLSDVESGAADFNLILVYDISRWGRFQDAGESARTRMMVSAYAERLRLTLASVTADHGTELDAALEVLGLIELKGKVVTADALHCNRRTVAAINAGGGDWCLALQANQDSLLSDAKAPVSAAWMKVIRKPAPWTAAMVARSTERLWLFPPRD